jgi:tungstate transport system ATP-binding protein
VTGGAEAGRAPARPVVELRGIRQRYGARTVLAIDSLAVAPGERLAVVGPNGSGKSTLLRLLAFLEPPSEGSVVLGGVVVEGARARRAARLRATLVEQRPFLFRGSVLSNVAWGLRARGATRESAEAAARQALDALRSLALADRGSRELSDGEIQRVALARAIAPRPDILLLDEPAAGADNAARHALDEALRAAPREMAVCISSHQMEEAHRWADRLLALHDGTPVPVTPDNLFRVHLTGGGAIQKVHLGTVTLEVVTDRSGPATIAIPPEELVLSREPLHSSARNVVTGRIVRIAEQGAAVRVSVAGGIPLVALVTAASYREMALAVGQPVVVSFKSVAVRVF